MELLMFSVFDKKAAAYTTPFFAPTRGVAIRNFAVACRNEGSEFSLFAEDYSLHICGKFDQQTGEVVAMELEIIATAASMKESEDV